MHRRILMTAWISAALLFPLAAFQPTVLDGDDLVVIRNGTLIDGTGAPPRPGTTVVVRDGRIDQIVEDGSVRVAPDVPVVDATGHWILPGFIDTHVHLPPAEPRLEATLAALLEHGITAVRVTTSRPGQGVEVRNRLENGELAGPTVRVAGPLLDGPGSFWAHADFAVIVESAEEARAEVRSQAESGVDFIKVYNKLAPEIVGAVIEEAHARGLEVIGHLGRTSWFEAVDLGIDAITHSGPAGMASSMVPPEHRSSFSDFVLPDRGFEAAKFGAFVEAVDPDVVHALARRLVEEDVVVDPNLVLIDAFLRGRDPEVYRALMPEERWDAFSPHPYTVLYGEDLQEAALAARDASLEAVGILHEEGVRLAAGTDVGNPWMTPGLAFHRELELLAEAGLDNASVIGAATRNGAVALGLLDELGTLEVGKRADVVILGADPMADIGNTSEIVAVYQGGRRIGE